MILVSNLELFNNRPPSKYKISIHGIQLSNPIFIWIFNCHLIACCTHVMYPNQCQNATDVFLDKKLVEDVDTNVSSLELTILIKKTLASSDPEHSSTKNINALLL